MYKTKLQETCHRRRWAVPKYTAVKEGPEHNPRFFATVFVNGVSFHSSSAAKSIKEAQNLAAQFGLLHLTTSGSSLSSDESTAGEPKSTTELNDLQAQYKCQLQRYTGWKNLNPPSYSITQEGSGNALRFRAAVAVEGHIFESPEFFRTIREAKCAAAKVALTNLSLDSSQQDEFCIYKNCLQELAQSADLLTPVYKTIECGVPHKPIFFFSVEVEGDIFYGKSAKTKKQAEMKAALVAYTVLKDRTGAQSESLRRIQRRNVTSGLAKKIYGSESHSFTPLDIKCYEASRSR